ncbi:MAG TPA: hypothetical protein VJZ91_01940 [Blastocatellia bacterium]|nr:hypothetical protein [Blastocatellia bacterium]
MKKVILSAVMVLALAGGSVFAASTQNKNAGGAKPAATHKKMTKKRHKKMAKKHSTANKNM